LNAVSNIAVYAYADPDVGSNGIHHIGPISTGEGVYWSRISNRMFYVMNVIGCSYPLTTTFSCFGLVIGHPRMTIIGIRLLAEILWVEILSQSSGCPLLN
jgi:hypothetical protein